MPRPSPGDHIRPSEPTAAQARRLEAAGWTRQTLRSVWWWLPTIAEPMSTTQALREQARRERC